MFLSHHGIPNLVHPLLLLKKRFDGFALSPHAGTLKRAACLNMPGVARNSDSVQSDSFKGKGHSCKYRFRAKALPPIRGIYHHCKSGLFMILVKEVKC